MSNLFVDWYEMKTFPIIAINFCHKNDTQMKGPQFATVLACSIIELDGD